MVLVILLSVFRISGSSVGAFDQLMGRTSSDLVFGKPNLIRSDEFSVNTPLTVGQSKNGYKRLNERLADGTDMSVVVDVPNADWSTLFKPQNWPFFFLPLENAFAFKWWLLAWGLTVSCYLLINKLLGGQRLLAALLSIAFFFNPMVQWWYQTITIAPLAYSFLILYLLISLETASGTTRNFKILALTWALTAFALVLYPPFQIPCALVVAGFYLGHLLDQKHSLKELFLTVRPVLSAVLGSVLLIGLFIVTRLDVVKAILNSAYPGHRVVKSGGLGFVHFFSGPFLAPLQSSRWSHYLDLNQSEFSNFIIAWPLLLVPLVYWVFSKRKSTRKFTIIGLIIIQIIFALRTLVELPDFFGKITLLSPVPHQRVLIGVGLGSFLLLVLLIRELQKAPWRFVALNFLYIFLVLSFIAYNFHRHFPQFLSSKLYILFAITSLTAAIGLMFTSFRKFGAALFLLLCLASTFLVNPLYKGLGIFTDKSTLPTVPPNEKWGYVYAGPLINLPFAEGYHSATGTLAYPHLQLWQPLDTNKDHIDTYNRYANVSLIIDSNEHFDLTGGDSFSYSFNPCHNPLKLDKILSSQPLAAGCLNEIGRHKSYSKEFYIYSIEQP